MSDDWFQMPAARFEWERLVRRANLAPMTKLIAFAAAQYGNSKGKKIHPGVGRLARVCGVDEKTARRHLQTLRDEGWLARLQESDWRRRTALGIADEYELTFPSDALDRKGMLDPNEAHK